MAASSLRHSESALGAYYRRLARRIGGDVAVFATARKLATLIYRLLRWGQPYVDDIGVKIREAAKIGAHLGLRYRWSDHVDEWYCGAGRDSFRFGLLTTGHRPEPPRGVPRVSFGSGTMHYVLAGSARHSRKRYPHGGRGPGGCTRRLAQPAALKLGRLPV